MKNSAKGARRAATGLAASVLIAYLQRPTPGPTPGDGENTRVQRTEFGVFIKRTGEEKKSTSPPPGNK